jgi:hypothetical protein
MIMKLRLLGKLISGTMLLLLLLINLQFNPKVFLILN